MTTEALTRYLELRKRLQKLADGLQGSAFADADACDAVANAMIIVEYNNILAELETMPEAQELSDEFEQAHGRLAATVQEVADWVERGKPKP